MSARYKSARPKSKARKKPKPRRKLKSKSKRKPARRCCGRSFKTASALASHRRGRHREATYKPRRRVKTQRWAPRRPKAAKLPPVRKCAICGDPGDHDGDGHPFEDWNEGEPKKVEVPRRVRPFVLRQVFGVTTPRSELR